MTQQPNDPSVGSRPPRAESDEHIESIAKHFIYRNAKKDDSWTGTRLGLLHPRIEVPLEDGELPILSAWFSAESYWAFTTRRFFGAYQDEPWDQPAMALRGWSAVPGQVRAKERTLLRVRFAPNKAIQCEIDPGQASKAPIYAVRFWLSVFDAIDVG